MLLDNIEKFNTIEELNKGLYKIHNSIPYELFYTCLHRDDNIKEMQEIANTQHILCEEFMLDKPAKFSEEEKILLDQYIFIWSSTNDLFDLLCYKYYLLSPPKTPIKKSNLFLLKKYIPTNSSEKIVGYNERLEAYRKINTRTKTPKDIEMESHIKQFMLQKKKIPDRVYKPIE